MAFNPPPTDRGSANGEDVLPVADYSMLPQFIYDTSSFSDRLAQLTVVSSTTEPVPEEGHEHVSKRTNADTTKKGKYDKSAGK